MHVCTLGRNMSFDRNVDFVLSQNQNV